MNVVSQLLYQVYDVTPFMEDHPGGDEVLLSATGNLQCVLFYRIDKDQIFSSWDGFWLLPGLLQEKMQQMILKM